jgi:hypothetical protein
MTHYHIEGNHQGIENRLIQPEATLTMPSAQVRRRQRLDGMLSFYCGAAA